MAKKQSQTKFRKLRFLERYPRYCQIDRAAKASGIDRTTVYKWEKDKEFAAAFEDAKKRAVEVLEWEARRRGVKERTEYNR